MRTGVQKKDDFINFVACVAMADANTKGLHVVSPILAQAIIESNWGESGLATLGNNLFGIKCGSSWKGASINMKTKEEYSPGTLTTISDNFRKYNSWEESIHDYFSFISTKRYKKLFDCTTALDYCNEIKNAGYATSSTYVSTLMNCISQYSLTDFDVALNNYQAPVENPEPVIETPIPENTEYQEEYVTPIIDYGKVVEDVINGLYGNGDERILNLSRYGYDAYAIQYMTNLQVKINALTATNEIIYNVINKAKEVLNNEIQ